MSFPDAGGTDRVESCGPPNHEPEDYGVDVAASTDDASRPSHQERSTRQKRALQAALESSGGFRSAQELFSEMRARGEQVGLTTVYNQLRALAGSGDVDVVRSDDGESLYRRCVTGEHHHHLVCRGCGRTIEVEGPEVEAWAERVADAYHYVDVRHTLEIFGTCARCADQEMGRTPSVSRSEEIVREGDVP